MGLFVRRRRPVARLAVGAATAGVAYHAGKSRAEQDAVDQQSQGAPPPAYAPPPSAPTNPTAGTTAELERLAKLHSSGALTDEEFATAKAGVLGG